MIWILSQLKKPSFLEYQLVVDVLENIGIEIEKPVYSPYEITEDDIILIENLVKILKRKYKRELRSNL